MATITDARKRELLELYDNLKKRVYEIEGKYSPDSRQITIDFPPTLGLSKLTYTKHTETELREIAEAQTAAKYMEKERILQNSYQSNLRSLNYSRSVAEANHQKRLAALEEEYAKDLEKLEHKLVDNGLWYSTMKTEALEKQEEDYLQKVENENTDGQNKDAAYGENLSKLQSDYNRAKAQLATQQQADVQGAIITLAEKEEKEARAVEKYNISVDEKEAKYQASCQRYLRYAQQAEDERVIAILKLYAQLGASGVEQRMQSDLLSTCRSELSVCTKGEAQYIFSLDTFLQVHLGTYYSALVDWANTTLRPD